MTRRQPDQTIYPGEQVVMGTYTHVDRKDCTCPFCEIERLKQHILFLGFPIPQSNTVKATEGDGE